MVAEGTATMVGGELWQWSGGGVAVAGVGGEEGS